MKIAFIRPRVQVARYIQHVPLAYIHLAAYLRERGHQSFIFDMVLEGMTSALVDALLRKHEIDVVGIGCITFEFPEALNLAQRLKASQPNLPIIFGGAHASSSPEECLESGFIDYAVVGEGELPLADLLDRLQEGKKHVSIQGVWFREGNTIIQSPPAAIPDVDQLPLPAYDLIDIQD
ncbi:MAG: cobalamin-dependent protein, partial [Syntrophales bacterium LBB04]|nr:cobalamin-dependent protein [Syntrophales bacterium LBB04]